MKPPCPTVAPYLCASNVHVHKRVSPQNLYRAFSSRSLQIILARAMKARRYARQTHDETVRYHRVILM